MARRLQIPCGCGKDKDPSAAQQKRQAERLAARATRQEAAKKFRSEQSQRIAAQQRRPQPSR